MKVVLSGYYGFHNVGDEAILFSIIHALRKQNPEIEITVLSNDPQYTEKTYGVKAVNRWKIKEVMAAIKSSDGLISGGGSLLQDKTGNRSVIYYSAIMLIAKLLGKPFAIYAQGIGPIDKKRNETITKFAISKASFLSVRDEDSKKFLKKIGVKKEITLVPDPVLGFEITTESSDWVLGSIPNKKFIAVSVRDWPSKVNYLQHIASSLDDLVQSGYEIVFIPMHGEHDEKTSQKLQKLMAEASIVAPADLSIEDKIRVIGKSELLIGMRLHALIFAAVMGRPFTALSYDPKIDAFSNLAKQPVAAHVNEENWSNETLTKIVNNQIQNLSKYEHYVQSYAQTAKKSAEKTAVLTLKAFS